MIQRSPISHTGTPKALLVSVSIILNSNFVIALYADRGSLVFLDIDKVSRED
jgi:hypothetical protein